MVARAVEIAHFLRCVARVLVNNREIFAQAIYNRGIGIGLAKGFFLYGKGAVEPACGVFILFQLIIDPAETVEISPVLRINFQGAFN